MQESLAAVAGVSEGQILADKYRVERVLGAGGMGVVVAARHVELDERVAIKFLLPNMLQDGVAVARFQREARAAVRIKSEHVARVSDVGRLGNGAPYMVMEYLEGLDLAAWVTQHGALPLAQAVDFVVQACVAVADAHALGIIHRDLKPANLFCVRRSDGQLCIKVLDFGISKLTEPGAGMSFTQTSAMMGSPLYMSPEQFRSSKNVDARSDIWALGSIAFELATGQPPFSASSVTELAIKIATEPPLPVSAVRPELPPAFAAVVARCLEKEPERRYQDVAALVVALAPFATPQGRALVERVVGIIGKPAVEAGRAPPLSDAADGSEARTAPALHWTSRDQPRRTGLAVTLGVAGVLGVLAAGGLVWWRTLGVAPGGTPASSGALVPPPSVPAEPATPVSAALAASSPALAATAEAPSQVVPSAPEPSASPAVAVGERRRLPSGRRPVAPAAASKDKRAEPGSATAALTAAAPTAVAAPSPRTNCDPPFYFDSHGNRVFKQECL